MNERRTLRPTGPARRARWLGLCAAFALTIGSAGCAATGVDTAGGPASTATGPQGTRSNGETASGVLSGFDIGGAVGELAPSTTEKPVATDPPTTAAPVITQAPVTQPRITQPPVTVAPTPTVGGGGGGGGGKPSPTPIDVGSLNADQKAVYDILGNGRQLEANLQNFAQEQAPKCRGATVALGNVNVNFTSGSVSFGSANTVSGAASAAAANAGGYTYIGIGVANGDSGKCVIVELAS